MKHPALGMLHPALGILRPALGMLRPALGMEHSHTVIRTTAGAFAAAALAVGGGRCGDGAGWIASMRRFLRGIMGTRRLVRVSEGSPC